MLPSGSFISEPPNFINLSNTISFSNISATVPKEKEKMRRRKNHE
jgi:hypothetical protein